MALSWSSLGTTYTTGTGPSLTFGFTPTAGDIIVVAICTREVTQTMTTAPSGYDPGPSQTGTNFNAFSYYKVSDGTETSVTCTLGANSNLRISAVVLQGASGTLAFDDSDSDATNVSTASTSGGFGSVTTTQAAAGICAILFMDQSWGAATEPAVSSYTNTNNDPVSANHGGIDMFTRVLSSTGTETPTWSGTGDTDQNFGVLLAFKDTVGGSVESGAGTAGGSSSGSAVGQKTSAAVALSGGTSTGAAIGRKTTAGVGNAPGFSTGTAVGEEVGGNTESGTGNASGSSTGAAVGSTTHAGTGNASGTSTGQGVGASTNAATGNASGTSNAAAVGQEVTAGFAEGAGTSNGTSNAQGIGQASGGLTGRLRRRGRYVTPASWAVKEAYEEIRTNAEARQELRTIVGPYSGQMPQRAAPPTSKVDWNALQHDAEAVYRLVVLWEEMIDDEEVLLLGEL